MQSFYSIYHYKLQHTHNMNSIAWAVLHKVIIQILFQMKHMFDQ